MKAPEKIYFSQTEDGRQYFTPAIPFEREFVAYVPTDAFIEKAFEFFGEHLWEYIDVRNANCDTLININGDKLKEDFGNYIKGE